MRNHKVTEAILACVQKYQPDAWFGALAYVPGPCFDILNYELYDWPGHGLPDDLMYRMNEGEYVVAAEYGQLAADSGDAHDRQRAGGCWGRGCALDPGHGCAGCPGAGAGCGRLGRCCGQGAL